MASGAPAKAGFAPGGHSSPRGGMADLMKEAGEARILKKLSFGKKKVEQRKPVPAARRAAGPDRCAKAGEEACLLDFSP